MKVRATQTGFYGGRRRDEGDMFDVTPEAFTAVWMEATKPRVDPLDHDADGKKGGAVALPAEGLAAMTVIELRALAKDRGVDLGKVTSKAGIIGLIEGDVDPELIRFMTSPAASDEDRIALANSLSGRSDIASVEEANAILHSAGASDEI